VTMVWAYSSVDDALGATGSNFNPRGPVFKIDTIRGQASAGPEVETRIMWVE
jgi:hypothetical protein